VNLNTRLPGAIFQRRKAAIAGNAWRYTGGKAATEGSAKWATLWGAADE
jgi:hypothetical protein